MDSKIGVAQLGARMHYAVPEIFQKSQRLSILYTDFYFKKSDRFAAEVLKGLGKSTEVARLSARRSDEIPDSKVVRFPFFTAWYSKSLSKALDLDHRILAYSAAGSLFCRKVIRNWRDSINCIYAFNTAAAELAQFAKSNGCRIILEQTIAPFSEEQRLLEAEFELFPEWLPENRKNPYRMSQVLRNYIQREEIEWQLADRIIAGSDFVNESLVRNGVKREIIRTVPYGFNLPKNIAVKKRALKSTTKINVLTVGLGLRKGTQYLLKAAAMSDRYCFRTVGEIKDTNSTIKRLVASATEYQGVVPRTGMSSHYQWADIFLLPSLCEGSATVVFEALAYGLPVITTYNSGSVITNFKEGRVITTHSAEAILDGLDYICDHYDFCSAAAARTAQSFTVEEYSKRLLNAIDN